MRIVEDLDFKRSIKKDCNMLRRFGGANMNLACKNPPITTNRIAWHIVKPFKAPKDRYNTIQVKKELNALKSSSLNETPCS